MWFSCCWIRTITINSALMKDKDVYLATIYSYDFIVFPEVSDTKLISIFFRLPFPLWRSQWPQISIKFSVNNEDFSWCFKKTWRWKNLIYRTGLTWTSVTVLLFLAGLYTVLCYLQLGIYFSYNSYKLTFKVPLTTSKESTTSPLLKVTEKYELLWHCLSYDLRKIATFLFLEVWFFPRVCFLVGQCFSQVQGLGF